MSRRYPLSKTGLDAAAAILREHIRTHVLMAADAPAIARDILTAYFAARHEDDVMGRNWSQTTWLLANMQPGDVGYFECSSIRLLRQRMPGARKLMGEPLAVWRTETLANGKIRAQRLENGARVERNALNNPKVVELVQLKIGDVKVSGTITATRGKGALDSSAKGIARRFMRNPRAQWKLRQTWRGVEIERTA